MVPLRLRPGIRCPFCGGALAEVGIPLDGCNWWCRICELWLMDGEIGGLR